MPLIGKLARKAFYLPKTFPYHFLSQTRQPVQLQCRPRLAVFMTYLPFLISWPSKAEIQCYLKSATCDLGSEGIFGVLRGSKFVFGPTRPVGQVV